jgi:hypothetical protein
LSQTTASQDSASFDPDGTALITRVIPEPMLISPEARRWLESTTRNQHGPQTLEQPVFADLKGMPPPETREALQLTADFLAEKVAR